MTRNEKIDLLENFCTFMAANGYMDNDWREEPPFAIDRFLELTHSSPPSEASEQKEGVPKSRNRPGPPSHYIEFEESIIREAARNYVSNHQDPEVRRMYEHHVQSFVAGARYQVSQFTRPTVVTQSEKGETAEEIIRKHIKHFDNWPHLHSLGGADVISAYKAIPEAMQEYSLLERSRAISECIEVAEKELEDTDDHAGYVACDNVVKKLKEKLKSRQ